MAGSTTSRARLAHWLGLMIGLHSTVLGAMGLGCASISGELPTPRPRPPTQPVDSEWLAGAAEIDITPPPGYAMGGHSLEGAVALGVWTRLRAQAIYLEDARGVPLVLVACDLWAVESGLVDRVAERLSEHPGLEHIGREHLIVAATHTHHSPGNFSTAPIYSRYAAAEPGHDSALFEALAGRIAAAVAEAAAARRPARLRRHTVAVPALARNRSVVPWLADPEARELLIANAGLPGCPEQPSAAGVDPCHAVVPLLDALHVVEAHGERTIAVMGSFAMHPTGMPNATELYQADVFGLASARAQAWLHRERRDEPGARTSGAAPPATTPPVVALFNGAQGDVSTNWDPQGRVSTVELGQALGEAVVAALDEPGREIHGEIEVAFAWRPVAGQRFVDSAGEPQRTARRARSGKGQLGGAEDGRTRLYDLGWREGKRRARPRRNGQGHKRPALPWPLSGLAPPPGSTPKAVPLSVVRLGDLPLVTVPAEATTVLGMRIGEQVADALPGHPEVLRVGLAGGYLSYLTTPQEYALQHYEGASMLYGEQAGTLVAMHLARLARSGVVERPSTYRYRVGPRHRWSMDRERRRSLAGLEDRLAWQLETGPLPGLPRFHVWDDAPRWPSDDPRSATTPRARVEGYTEAEGWQTLAPGGLPIDDLTGALAMLLTHVDGQRWRWATWWLDPGAPLHQPLRFHIESIGEGPICSESFTLGQWYRPTGPGWLEPAPCSSRPQ